jgi:hypothetical protein
MRSIEAGPSEVTAHIAINAQLINSPCLANDGNIAFSVCQINLAPVQPCESG